MAALLDHLWQSSLVALLAAALTFTVRRNGARVRFWLWFAASFKFLLPFALLAALGGWLSRFYPHALAAPLGIAPAMRLSAPAALLPVHESLNLVPWLLGVWALGLVAVTGLRLLRWLRLRLLLSDARELKGQPLPVKTSSALLEPGLFGIFRPVVVMPAGLLAHLAPGEMASILAHEAAHLARRDNLTACVQMLVEALFWFYPPVWLIGARMIAERERACDESVLATGHDPLVYAQGILKACRFCVQSPLACVAGVSGGNLGRRMERIMTAPGTRDLDGARILLLGSAMLATISLPVLAGFVTSPFALEMGRRAAQMQAQIQSSIQQAVAAPFLSPQDDFVSVLRAARRAKPRAIAMPQPAPQPEPAFTPQSDAPPPAPRTAPEPFTIVPVARQSADTALDIRQAVVAIDPTGAGDPEAITCRVPQILPSSRLPGPIVCKLNRVWAGLRARGEEIMPDGHTVIVIGELQRRRTLAAQNCNAIPGGTSIANMLALPNNFCS